MFWATTFIGYFYILTFIIGFGAIVLRARPIRPIMSAPTSRSALLGGGNMPAIHLAQAVGGDLMKGFIAAVAFATILAVVSGLTLSGASAVSHDLYASVFRHGRVDEATEVRVSRITTVVLGIVAILLGILFEKINVAFMVGLAFAVAASANFPVLLLSMLWKGLTTRGAFIGGFVGLISAVVLTIVSPGDLGGGVRLPEGLGPVPLRVAGALHHAARLPLLLALLGHRQVEAARRPSRRRSKRNMCARRPASARKAPPRTEAERGPKTGRPASAGRSFLAASYSPRRPAVLAS